MLAPFVAAAERPELRLDADGRWMPQLPAHQVGGALVGELAFQPYAREDGLTHQLDLVAYGRYDFEFDRHSHADAREAAYTLASPDYELRLGISRAFWGVVEAVNLVDVINQEDWLEDVSSDDKLGQPLISAAWSAHYGIWRAYYLPLFRPRQFPDRAVFPVPFPIEESEARYESSRAEQHGDWALRWTNSIGSLDYGLSVFEGTAREPLLRPCAARGSGRPGAQEQANCDLEEAFGGEPDAVQALILQLGSGLGLTPSQEELEQEALDDIVLVPHYDQMRQYGAELQWITGGWALRLEGRYREIRGLRHTAAATGFEYTQGTPFGWPADFGYVVEYLYDDAREGEGFSPLRNDLLLAWRGTFSDIAGTQILAGVIQDLDDRGRVYSVEASRRLSGSLRVELDLRIFSDIPANDPLAFLADTDRLQLLLSYYL